TGALLVGDGLRGSLRKLTNERLGWVDNALVAGRFLREDLASGLKAERVAPAIFLQGSASKAAGPRANKITILGVNGRFWPDEAVPLGPSFWRPAEPVSLDDRPVVLNAALARELEVGVGDTVTLHLQKVSGVPREALLGQRKAGDVVEDVRLKVAAVIDNDRPGSQFSLNPSPAAPRNAFLPLAVLQDILERQDRQSRALPPKPVNAL